VSPARANTIYHRLDIIKTRLQTATVTFQSHPHPPSSRPLSVRQVARQIYTDEVNAHRYRYPHSTVFRFVSRVVRDDNESHVKAEKWSLRLLGLKGYARGIRPTALSSFVGSSVTILAFEVILEALGAREAVG
jgi:solute carrier family 25 carnitine/acylcarnitine transporter 20/29